MRIGSICRLHSFLHSQNTAIRLGVIAVSAGLLLAPALAQGPLGAAAAAAGAAAEATIAAPAPNKRAAPVVATGNGVTAGTKTENAGTPAPTEEAQNRAAPAARPGSPTAAAPAPPLTGVAAECADLLKMATNLKADVDKTTKDVLSVSVVRDADQIEQTAKKIRDEQH